MNNLLKNLFRILALCIGFAALAATPTLAQAMRADIKATPRAEIVAPPVEGQLNSNQIVVNRRPAIPYKPFAVMDPKTGKSISPDAMLTMRNGQRLAAGKYWDQINKMEEQLSAMGYSLRSGPGDKPGVPKRIELQRIPTPVATLQRQGKELTSSYMPNTLFHPLNIVQAAQQQKTVPVINSGLLSALAPSLRPLTLKEAKSFNFSFGDSSTFSAFLNGKLELDGTSTSTSFEAEADAGGSLFSKSFDVLKLSGKLTAPQQGQLNINISASVLGTSIYNVNENETSIFSKQDSVSKTLDKSTTIHFPLLGIPMSAKVGVQGTAGLKYAVTVAPVKAVGSIAPSIKTDAYAQVSIDIAVASAGVGGKLTVLNLDGNLTGGVSIVPDAKNKANYNYNLSYQQTIDTLDGSLYAFLTEGDCAISIPGVGRLCAEQDFTFFTFSGFKSSGVLFNESKSSPVFGPPLLNPGNR